MYFISALLTTLFSETVMRTIEIINTMMEQVNVRMGLISSTEMKKLFDNSTESIKLVSSTYNLLN